MQHTQGSCQHSSRLHSKQQTPCQESNGMSKQISTLTTVGCMLKTLLLARMLKQPFVLGVVLMLCRAGVQ